MRIHILGICGTFMAGIASLAQQAGHIVSGSDQNVYPPMSLQLEALGIKLMNGYDPAHITADIDCVIVGNVISRGNLAMEYILNNNINYTSGPQWLAENILRKCWVLAVSGTHGKTTTTSMLTWILDYAGFKPGFLVGGIPENFGLSARLPSPNDKHTNFFVIEADEYDSAFFDKRSKFIHYHPKTLIFNNLEFDHADIFPDLAAIKQQFHFLLRTIPGNGQIVFHAADVNIADVIALGSWSDQVSFGGESGQWRATLLHDDGSSFEVYYDDISQGQVDWELSGQHNVDNALAAIASAVHAGVNVNKAIAALGSFKNVKRRMEIIGQHKDITFYDDFAHHPTAIATTLAGLRAKVGKAARIVAILEFGSYTMRLGVHKDAIAGALVDANWVVCKQPALDWDLTEVLAKLSQPTACYKDVDTLVTAVLPQLQAGDHVIVMSNSGFDGIHQKLLAGTK
jgi:UDP-N-acetylmuramate: L-alanyl-gamma-D-glutamyl-meso-diaminopimelate ligase